MANQNGSKRTGTQAVTHDVRRRILPLSDFHLRRSEDWREFVGHEGEPFITEGEHATHIFHAQQAERQRTIDNALKLLYDPAIHDGHTLQEALDVLHETVQKRELLRAEPSIKGVSKLQSMIYAMRDYVPPTDSPLWGGIDFSPGSLATASDDDIAAYASDVGDGQSKVPPKRQRVAGDEKRLELEDGTVLHADDKESQAAMGFLRHGLEERETSPEMIRFDRMLDKLRDIGKEQQDIGCEYLDLMCQNARDYAEHVAMGYDEGASTAYIKEFDTTPREAAHQYLDQFLIDSWHLLRTMRNSHGPDGGAHKAEDTQFVRATMREIMAHAIRDASDRFETLDEVKPYFADAVDLFEAHLKPPEKGKVN